MASKSLCHARFFLAAVTALLLVPAGSEAATDLADPFMDETAHTLTGTGAGTLSFTGCDPIAGSCGTVSASASYSGGSGQTSVSGSFDAATLDPSPGTLASVGMGSRSNLWFQVVVDGPCISDGDGGCQSIPVITTASGQASAIGTMAFASIRAPGGGFDACAGYLVNADGIPYLDCGAMPTSFSGTITGSLFPGQPDTVHMGTSGGGRNFVYTAASYFATVDPMVVIDPTFPLIGLYTISVSPDLASAVPEPSSFGLLGAGVLVLLGRKSRSNALFVTLARRCGRHIRGSRR